MTTRSQARETGYEAHEQGEPRSANPYAVGTWESDEWFAGWDEAVEITWSIVEPTVSTERIDNVTGWDIEIDGDVYPIVRDVTHAHPHAVHAVFMTRNESELQSLLDSHNTGDWFDGSKYIGRDAAGVGLVFGNNSDVE